MQGVITREDINPVIKFTDYSPYAEGIDKESYTYNDLNKEIDAFKNLLEPKIKKENPTWWTDELKEDLVDATLDAYDAEADIVEWIFEEGDLDFLTKEQTLEFIKHRFNESLNAIGIDSVFSVDEKILETTEWFDDEILTTKHTDFFNKRSINYSKKQKSITEDDLF